MLIIVIIAMFGSLIGFAQLSAQAELAQASNTAWVTALAENMASYRTGMIDYANTHPGPSCNAVGTTFPTGYVALNPPLWTNCILADGTIVIYASNLPEVDITDTISVMAQRSVTAGRANHTPSGAISIDLPFNSTDTPITVPTLPPSASPLPLKNGVPVWLAHRS